MGSVTGILTALERLRDLGADVVVPGHGSVCGPEAIVDQIAYLRFVQELARSGADAGLAPLEVAHQADLGIERLGPDRPVPIASPSKSRE
jgi:cyclase